jgi:hypothetical protein
MRIGWGKPIRPTKNDLKTRIRNECRSLNGNPEVLLRARIEGVINRGQLCLEAAGGGFEHLISKHQKFGLLLICLLCCFIAILNLDLFGYAHAGLFTRGVFLNFFLPQPIIHIATISWFQILKIIITESTMALTPVSLTLNQKIFVNSKNLSLQ